MAVEPMEAVWVFGGLGLGVVGFRVLGPGVVGFWGFGVLGPGVVVFWGVPPLAFLPCTRNISPLRERCAGVVAYKV